MHALLAGPRTHRCLLPPALEASIVPLRQIWACQNITINQGTRRTRMTRVQGPTGLLVSPARPTLGCKAAIKALQLDRAAAMKSTDGGSGSKRAAVCQPCALLNTEVQRDAEFYRQTPLTPPIHGLWSWPASLASAPTCPQASIEVLANLGARHIWRVIAVRHARPSAALHFFSGSCLQSSGSMQPRLPPSKSQLGLIASAKPVCASSGTSSNKM